MPSLTVKLPAKLDRKIRATARQRKESVSAMARRALEREAVNGGPDFAVLAAKHRGMFTGPSDLSTRKGYGR